ncbi:MAG: hypothetical protein ABJA94_04295 [Rhodoglobus sp.]
MGSSEQMKVDYDHLAALEEELNKALAVIGREFEATAALAVAVGDGTLSAHAIDFGNSWNKHRFDIRDRLTWLRDSVKNIQHQLSQVDEKFAAGLKAPPTPKPSPGPTPVP